VHRKDLSQVQKLRRNSAFVHRIPTERNSRPRHFEVKASKNIKRGSISKNTDETQRNRARKRSIEGRDLQASKFFQGKGRSTSSGGGASTIVRSVVKEEIWTIGAYIQKQEESV
jgi:hypothetical protein